MQTGDPEIRQRLERLLDGIGRWGGDLATAGELRETARGLSAPRRRPETDDERVLFVVLNAYARKKPERLIRYLVDDPSRVRIAGPFVGDPEMGTWPHVDPLRIDESDAVDVLELLKAGAVADAAARSLAWTMFDTRKRGSWVPASSALASMGQRDSEIREEIGRRWRDWFPSGLPDAWPPAGLAALVLAGAAEGRGPAVHSIRHLLHLASGTVAIGGDEATVAGFTPEGLLALGLPPDPTDQSAVLLSVRALLAGRTTRPGALAWLGRWPGRVAADEQSEAVMRGIADAISADTEDRAQEVHDALCARLVQPLWHDDIGARQVDSLVSWVRTARWFEAHGDTARLEEMRAASGDAADVIARAIGSGVLEGEDPVQAVKERLGRMLDPVQWATLPVRLRAPLAVETLLLLDHPDVGDLDWPALVAASVGTPGSWEPQSGTAHQVGRADLALRLVELGCPTAILLRDQVFDRPVVMQLARCQNGLVARQVAIQVERLLRQSPSPLDQVRLVWSLLASDPPGETFRQLQSLLRGRGMPLHRLVEAAAQLDAARDRSAGLDALLTRFEGLVGEAEELLIAGGADDAAVVCLGSLAERMGDVLGVEEVASGDWLDRFERIVGDGVNEEGLHGWTRWLGYLLPTVVPSFRRLRDAASAVRDSRPAVPGELCEELDGAIADFGESVRYTSWPEREFVGALLSRLSGWNRDARQRSLASEVVIRKVRRAIDRRDEGALVGLVREPSGDSLALLPPDDLRGLHRFLLEQLAFGGAQKLRGRVAERVQLPSIWSHLAPLGAGVVAGSLLVLDLGTAWNEVVAPGHLVGYVATVVLSLASSLSLLLIDMAARRGKPQGRSSSAVRALVRHVIRVLPVFLGSFALAFLASSVLLATLHDTAAREVASGDATLVLAFWKQAGLWSSLSLFFGLFLGLILQGRSVVKR